MSGLRAARSCVLFAVLVSAGNEVPAAPHLQVSLQSQSEGYVLGEVVLLTVTVKNVGAERAAFSEVIVDRGIPEIYPYLSGDGELFERCITGIDTDHAVLRRMETLKPGEAKDYRLRVLYAFHGPSHLAFDKPGRYWIKARFPWHTPRARGGWEHGELYSNVVTIRIRQPEGPDAGVWETIRAPDFLFFLQLGLVPPSASEIPTRTAKLLGAVPNTRYAGAMKYALEEHYRRRANKMTRDEVMQDRELQRIRAVTGIVEPPEGPFPDDRRLDVEISYHFPELTSYEKVLAEVSRQSGVPLALAREVREVQIKSAKVTGPLRRLMRSLAGRGRTWLRDGEGYRLVPVTEDKQE